LLYTSQSKAYSDYVEENPVEHLCYTSFKTIIKEEKFCRASGLVDACPICESVVKNETIDLQFAEKAHKKLVSEIGAGLQVIAEHLPKGVVK
jgi:hypothetical protein